MAAALLEGAAVGLTRRAINLALSGDVVALRLCLERLIPRRIERCIQFKLPTITEPTCVVAALESITDGLERGELNPTEVRALISIIEAGLRAVEVLDRDRRLSALEEHHARS